MKARAGFTTVELAVLALVVGVLAAVCPSFDGPMAAGILVVGLAPLTGKLLRNAKVPLLLAVVAGLGTAAAGVALIAKGVETAPGLRRAAR